MFAASDRDLGRTCLVIHNISTENSATVKLLPRWTFHENELRSLLGLCGYNRKYVFAILPNASVN